MTDTQRPWDRLTPESDPAYEACAAYLDTGSLRDACPFRDAEHDGATQPGDHAMRVTSWNCSRGADVSRRGRQGPIIRI